MTMQRGLHDHRDAILEGWLTRTLQSYPEQTQDFIRREKDRFRNPAGQILKEGLTILVDELLGEMDADRTRNALLEIVRLRAVQDFTPSQAVGFVFLLKDALNETVQKNASLRPHSEEVGSVIEKIDQLSLLAFDLYAECREKMSQIRIDEARRKVFMLERSNPKYFAPEEPTEED